MPRPVHILFIVFFISLSSFAQDTTSVRIFFDFDKYNLTKDAKDALAGILPADTFTILKSIKIYGHCDQKGSDNYNENLSLKRAKQAAIFLVNTGIQPSLISIIEGKGERELINNNDDDIARQENRRVVIEIYYEIKSREEIVIISKSKKNEPEKKEEIIETPKNMVIEDTLPKGPTITEQINNPELKLGENLILQNINFQGSRHVFLPMARVPLQQLYDAMKNIPTLEIEIQGHVCCTKGSKDGDDWDTQTSDLSYQRAKAVFEYLMFKGIKPDRMRYKGMARKHPLTKERTEMERTMNRRVEIKILKK